MSFTSNVKSEAVMIECTPAEKQAELSAIFRILCQIHNGIFLMTENASVARRVFALVKELFGLTPKITVRRGYNFKKGYLYFLEIKQDTKQMIETLELALETPKFIAQNEVMVRAYLRGIFLSCGSINDPKKSRYHLEFLVDNKRLADFLIKQLNRYDLNSKILKRDNKYMIYIKEAEKISDFLRVIGTVGAVLYFEDIRIYRDHKNMTNRLNNCEQANVDKMIHNAQEQMNDIMLIKENIGIDVLDEKIKVVVQYRIKYPESSLQELSEIISMETNQVLTKSGLQHRFKKIKDFASKIRETKSESEK